MLKRYGPPVLLIALGLATCILAKVVGSLAASTMGCITTTVGLLGMVDWV